MFAVMLACYYCSMGNSHFTILFSVALVLVNYAFHNTLNLHLRNIRII